MGSAHWNGLHFVKTIFFLGGLKSLQGRQIEELKIALNESRKGGNDSQV